MQENMNISAKESGGCYELKQYKSRFDEECSTFFLKKKKYASCIAAVTGSESN